MITMHIYEVTKIDKFQQIRLIRLDFKSYFDVGYLILPVCL